MRQAHSRQAKELWTFCRFMKPPRVVAAHAKIGRVRWLPKAIM
jgi:hypothetical protein